MNGLALCAGIGGLEIGVHLTLGSSYRTVCYVEREAYPVACLVKRMGEGHLAKAPIWDDLNTFNGKPWRGKVDIITAGFPCQPYSQAGKGQKEKDPRHIWPEIARIINECKPNLVFLENVTKRAYKEPWRNLREMGFTLSDPYTCTAAEMGAGHLRRRVFVLAYSDSLWRQQQERCIKDQWEWISDSAWWSSEPKVERVVYGVPNGVDRHRALGNAVVPQVAAKAFDNLMEGI